MAFARFCIPGFILEEPRRRDTLAKQNATLPGPERRLAPPRPLAGGRAPIVLRPPPIVGHRVAAPEQFPTNILPVDGHVAEEPEVLDLCGHMLLANESFKIAFDQDNPKRPDSASWTRYEACLLYTSPSPRDRG